MGRRVSKHLLRQCLILIPIVLQSISTGGMLGFPSVLNPAIQDPDTTDIKATPDQASWIGSVIGSAGFVGFFFLAPIFQRLGRKPTNFAKNSTLAIGWIIMYFASSIQLIFAGRIIQGLTMGGIYINVITIAEYVSPHRRGYFIAIQKFAISLGTLICHTLALWCTWRQIAAIFSIPTILASILTLFWKESPYFLAFKGRFDKCEDSFHWFNGKTKRNKELQDLITAQNTRLERKQKSKNQIQIVLKDLARKDYRKSFSIVAILTISIDFSGRNYFKAYVVQIMSELIADKSVALYCSILGSFLTLIALLLSTFMVRRIRRRLLLLSFIVISILIMYCIFLIILLKTKYNWLGLAWLTPLMVLLLNFVVHVGLSPVCFIIIGEIFPLDLKGISILTTGIVFTLSYTIFLKVTPFIIHNLGIGSLYVICGTGLLFCLVPLLYILPETKDQTLLEIEDTIKGNENVVDKSEVTLLDK